MKQGKKPTRSQWKRIRAARLNPENWLVERDTPEIMTLVHRISTAEKPVIRQIRKDMA